MQVLSEDNFLDYTFHVYNNPQCSGMEEFLDDINRIKYIKKLITRYRENDDLKVRLILNHVIILGNVFGPVHLPRILYFKLQEYFDCVKPFLESVGMCPIFIVNVFEKGNFETESIVPDVRICRELKKL